jgi:ATP-dependent DNA ligase
MWDDTIQKYRVLSRNLRDKNINNFRYVIDELEDIMLLDHDHVIDFEVWSKDWSRSVGLAQSKYDLPDEDARQIKAAVFDRINRQDFLSGESLELQRDRISPIRYWFDKQDELEYVIIPRNQDIRDLDHAWEIAEDYYDMSIGIEGMVAKSYNSPYGEKHSDKWIKFKFYTTSDFPIIGVQEGEGRNKGTTGSLLLEIKPSYIDEETGEEIPAITTSSGSGLDLDTANLIWSRKDEIAYLYSIGKPCYAEIKYLGITPDNCLREPIFQRFRDDK